MLIFAALVASAAQPQATCDQLRKDLQGRWVALEKYLVAVADEKSGAKPKDNPSRAMMAKMREADRAGCEWIVRKPEGLGFKPEGFDKGIMVYPRVESAGGLSVLSTFDPQR